jgi:hypothetical protein
MGEKLSQLRHRGVRCCCFSYSAENEYVVVTCNTQGVEAIVPVNVDFYITTRGVSSPPFEANVSVAAKYPWRLLLPPGGTTELGIGEYDVYKVEDETGVEDDAEGRIYVLKLDIEQSETNVCWKISSVTLNLTPDSAPGGEAVWTSQPAGISGAGNSVTFDPSSLAPGEYTVSARSGIVPDYSDSCTVRIIKVDVINSIIDLRENSFTSPEYCGKGMGDEFATRYFAAVMELKDPIQKATNLWNDVELGPMAIAELQQAVTSFEVTCCALAEEATIAGRMLALVPPECQHIEGLFQFTVCASPRTANVAINLEGVDGWNSTASFGEHLWTSIKPLSFSVGTQVVRIEQSGNLGVLSVNVHIGHPCDEVVKLDFPIIGLTEEDCVLPLLSRFNENKTHIKSRKQIVDNAKDLRSIFEGWLGLIPVAGAAISASINTAGTIAKNVVLRYYNEEMNTNLYNTKVCLLEIEELAERTPAGGAETHDRVEQAEMLEAGN